MNIGTYEHVSSCVADHFGLKWNDRKLALKELGATDCVFLLFFVSIHVEQGDYIYLVNRVELTQEKDGLRVKLPYFNFTQPMATYLEQVSHRLWYVTVGDELIRIKEKTLAKMGNHLNIRVGGDERVWFEQDLISSEIKVKQTYIPGRGKRKKVEWT